MIFFVVFVTLLLHYALCLQELFFRERAHRSPSEEIVQGIRNARTAPQEAHVHSATIWLHNVSRLFEVRSHLNEEEEVQIPIFLELFQVK